MRFITYPGTDVVIICFSVVRASSLVSVVSRWLPELDKYCPPTVPIILVGTQTDLRPAAAASATSNNDPGRRSSATAADTVATVGREHGMKTAKRIGAYSYVECSALSGDGLADVFVEAAKAALNASSSRRRRRRSSSCSRRTLLFDAASSLICWRTTAV